MPVSVDRYSDATRSYTAYKLYSKAEIRCEWGLFKDIHLKNMSSDAPYVTCTVKCEAEALVLTALLMRRAAAIPACFYYDKDSKRLLAHCKMIGEGEDKLRETFQNVISIFSDYENLKSVTKDPLGQDLFNEVASPIEIKQPPTSDYDVLPWSGRIHEHLNNVGYRL